MEAAQDFDFQDGQDDLVPVYELPEEIVGLDEAEIDESIGFAYIPDVETDEPDEEAWLQKDTAEPALLCYLSLHVGDDGWYRQEKVGKRGPGGIFIKLSSDTGIEEGKARTIVRDWLEAELIEAEYCHPTKPDSPTGLRLTSLGTETFKEILNTRPEEVEHVEASFIYIRQETANMIRYEINHEREILGEDHQVFEDLSAFPSVRELNAHLDWLTKVQASLEIRVEKEETRRRIKSSKEKITGNC